MLFTFCLNYSCFLSQFLFFSCRRFVSSRKRLKSNLNVPELRGYNYHFQVDVDRVDKIVKDLRTKQQEEKKVC